MKKLTSVHDEYGARERLRKTTPTVKESLKVQEAQLKKKNTEIQ